MATLKFPPSDGGIGIKSPLAINDAPHPAVTGWGASLMGVHEEVKQEGGKGDMEERQKATQAQPPS